MTNARVPHAGNEEAHDQEEQGQENLAWLGLLLTVKEGASALDEQEEPYKQEDDVLKVFNITDRHS